MEISTFLQQSVTWNLRKSYLNNVLKKHAEIIVLLKRLLDPNLIAAEKKSALSTLFHEIHRLKGSSGTYGFNEVSWIYKEMSDCTRLMHEGECSLDFSDIQKTLKTANELSKNLPFLFLTFQSTEPSILSPSSTSILCVNKYPAPWLTHMELFFLRKKIAFFTTQSAAEALGILKFTRPRWLLVNSEILDACDMHFLSALTQHEYGKDSRLALLLKNTADTKKKKWTDTRVDHLFSLTTPIKNLLEEIESWVCHSMIISPVKVF